MVFDCGPEAEDESELISLLKHELYSSRQQQNSLPCMEGYSKCYYLQDVCTYKLNLHNNLTPCRNGGHLHDCTKFECNLMFKCTNSYCILWSYVCDGKWDCPFIDDELTNPVCTDDRIYVYMYKCRKTSQICLYVGNICDGTRDCPFGDDELLCDLKDVKCPLQCNHLLFAIDCQNISYLNTDTEIQAFYLSDYVSIYIYDFRIYSLQTLHGKLDNAKILKLPKKLFEANLQHFKF